MISHDRWFLDRIATHVLAFEGDSQVRWFEGNFSEYEEWRHKELGAAADQPHRIKYKPLARARAHAPRGTPQGQVSPSACKRAPVVCEIPLYGRARGPPGVRPPY